jgi:hypothetical protein
MAPSGARASDYINAYISSKVWHLKRHFRRLFQTEQHIGVLPGPHIDNTVRAIAQGVFDRIVRQRRSHDRTCSDFGCIGISYMNRLPVVSMRTLRQK